MDGDVIEVASFSTAVEAQLLLTLFREADVGVFLSGEQTAAVLPGAEVHLFVARADLKRAQDLLNCFWSDAGPGWEDEADTEEGFWMCPKCGDAAPEAEAACPSCGAPREGPA